MERAAVGHGVACVHGEVEHRIRQQRPIATHGGFGAGRDGDLHAPVERASRKIDDFREHGCQRERLLPLGVASRQREQAACEIGPFECGAFDAGGVFTYFDGVIGVLLHEFGVPNDAREQVVEVVRHAACQLTYCFELGALRELLREAALLGDVVYDSQHMARRAIGLVHHGSGDLRDGHAAI